jgi:hypothetical protein
MSRPARAHSRKKRWTLFGVVLGTTATLMLVLGLDVLTGQGGAARSVVPQNTSPPTISGTPAVGETLTADPGSWGGTQPIDFDYQWRRCDETGGSCSAISGALAKTYTLKPVDADNTLRVRVTATNRDGSSAATAVPTAAVKAAPVTGCPPGSGPVPVEAVAPPARLVVDQLQFSPLVVGGSTQTLIARFHVSNTCNQAVRGALVYVTAVPFNQLNVPAEQSTDSNGWAEINLQTLTGFPASRKQQLLALFVRARKSGENLLTGISTRRLVSVRVDLNQ